MDFILGSLSSVLRISKFSCSSLWLHGSNHREKVCSSPSASREMMRSIPYWRKVRRRNCVFEAVGGIIYVSRCCHCSLCSYPIGVVRTNFLAVRREEVQSLDSSKVKSCQLGFVPVSVEANGKHRSQPTMLEDFL